MAHSKRQAGTSISSIARQLGISRVTVYRYLRSDSDPTVTRMPLQPSMLDGYLPYLYERWQTGCENGVQLWREIKELGYPGSRTMVARWVAQQRQRPAQSGPRKYQTVEYRACRDKAQQERAQRTPSSKSLSYFLLRAPTKLNMAEQAVLQHLQEVCSDVAVGYPLVQEFLQMVHKESVAQLDGWINRVTSSKLEVLASFAAGLERDKAAVLAGLTEDWNNERVPYCTSSPRS